MKIKSIGKMRGVRSTRGQGLSEGSNLDKIVRFRNFDTGMSDEERKSWNEINTKNPNRDKVWADEYGNPSLFPIVGKPSFNAVIDTAYGKGDVVAIEKENIDGKWEGQKWASYENGYWVIHKGKYHAIYEVKEGKVYRGDADVKLLEMQRGLGD